MAECIISGRGGKGESTPSGPPQLTALTITNNTELSLPSAINNTYHVLIFGGGGAGIWDPNGGPGGGGGNMNMTDLIINDTNSIQITIGKGGNGGYKYNAGSNGGTTSFGTYLSATGGECPAVYQSTGANGGTGGGGVDTASGDPSGGHGFYGGGGGSAWSGIGGNGGTYGGGGGGSLTHSGGKGGTYGGDGGSGADLNDSRSYDAFPGTNTADIGSNIYTYNNINFVGYGLNGRRSFRDLSHTSGGPGGGGYGGNGGHAGSYGSGGGGGYGSLGHGGKGSNSKYHLAGGGGGGFMDPGGDAASENYYCGGGGGGFYGGYARGGNGTTNQYINGRWYNCAYGQSGTNGICIIQYYHY